VVMSWWWWWWQCFSRTTTFSTRPVAAGSPDLSSSGVGGTTSSSKSASSSCHGGRVVCWWWSYCGGSGRQWDSGGSGLGLWVWVFYSFQKLFAESLKVPTAHHCCEPDLRLMAKGCLPAKLCRELHAGGYSRQTLCREYTRLTANKLFPVVMVDHIAICHN
jgi:hypothetical protein